MRDDITLRQCREYQQELEDVFKSMIDLTKLQKAYDTFREKTGSRAVCFELPVIDMTMPDDQYYLGTSKIGKPCIRFEGVL